MTFELIKQILERRESLLVILENESITITFDNLALIAGQKIISLHECYDDIELNERVQIKRKYGQYEHVKINNVAPIRNNIVEFVGTRFVTESELKNFLLKLEEDKGSSINPNWFKNNQKYFENFKNRGQNVWTLSKYGKRVFEFIVKNKDSQKINENVLNEGTESVDKLSSTIKQRKFILTLNKSTFAIDSTQAKELLSQLTSYKELF